MLGWCCISGETLHWWLMFFLAIVAIFVAMMHDDLKRWIFPPKISIQLSPHYGALVELTNRVTGERVGRAWYFHITVTNSRLWSPARESRVICHSIKKLDRDGKTTTESYATRIPLLWSHWDVLGRIRDLYSSDLCDICFVHEGNPELHLPLWFTNTAVVSSIKADERLDFKLEFEHLGGIAREKWRVSITWNGQWREPHAAMKENVKITVNRDDS